MDTVVGPGVVKDHGLSVIPLSISGSLGVVTEMSGSIEKRMKQLIGVDNLLVEGRSLSKHKCEVLLLARGLSGILSLGGLKKFPGLLSI